MDYNPETTCGATNGTANVGSYKPNNWGLYDMQAGMSITHFRRRFADILHITPARYLATIRINAAIRLMTSTNKLLSEIAQECGFYDQSHFIRTFKRLRRQTPAQYRRAHFSA